MPKRRITEDHSYSKEALDIKSWPNVLIDNLTPDEKEVYLKRKKAIDMYFSEHPIKTIRQEVGIDFNTLRRLIRRCLMQNANGEVYGYRGLIPQKKLIQYKRLDRGNSSNYSGMFSDLLKTYPILKEEIEAYYFQNNRRKLTDPKMKAKYIHKKFIEKCKAIGLKEHMYPFTTQTLAKRSLERYLKELDNQNFALAAKRSGEAASKIANTTGINNEHNLSILRPLERVQFDGHRIDGIFSITFKTPDGDEITKVLERLWLLVILDVATRAIVGYYLSANIEYTAPDVMQCIKNCVIPKTKKELTIPGLSHKERGGFPSECFPDMQWGLWDELLYDNGKSNLSALVTDRLDYVVGCSTNAGPVAVPVRRGYIERFFGVLEESGYHRMINTTGNNPKDPRRNNPEINAVKYSISFEHLEELTDVLISDYNGTPNEGLNNFTPLEILEQRIERGLIPRIMPEEKRGDAIFLSAKAKRKVNGNIKEGRRPFIHYEGVDYRNDILSRSSELIGVTMDLIINIDDLRVLQAYLPDGSEFGSLTAVGKWGITPHSLQTRLQINKLKARKLLFFTSEDDPIDCYHRYLEEQALTNKQSRNRLVEQQRKKKKHEKINDKNADESKLTANEDQSNKPSNIVDISRGNNPIKRVEKNFKTITF
ncbi:hypothetical protein [Cohnella cholangitidis]|uniref:Transposase family protein n=1 Tax=Cohnella cholangitidis TaxID=2598458 RepID=A0A7G5C693_9BACL|nr:hypothetical protein [Cohnella cholangitidis]QMV44727.1 transposase family protein [Cohnella cholangitidis]